MGRLALAAVAPCAIAATLAAQQPAPVFEVVSVRRNTSTDGTINIPPTPPDGVVLHNRALAEVVRYAYQLPPFL
ncbi:MAG TPA: hypothetical protein VM818_06195, partial [Vicinamibacterales bacterium]|nr:hypothetical protein [Vicinamibacterales bacterium]